MAISLTDPCYYDPFTFTLLNASQDPSQVVLSFESGITLIVSLLPEAYHGPEAMVLNKEGEPIFVWN